MATHTHECVVIGGGAAGLCAATYLGRFNRDVLVVDAGESRMRRIPLTRNVPGWPDGVNGADLHDLMSRQARTYGARLLHDRIESIERLKNGFALQGAQLYQARTILIATGSRLEEPDIERLDHGLAQGVIRYCPICDGYETRGKRVAVLARATTAIDEALFLRTFAEDVSYLCETADAQLSPADQARAAAAQISYMEAPVTAVDLDGGVAIATLQDGARQEFDVVYPCLGCTPQNALLQALGCTLSEAGGVETDRHQRTSVSGIYAAGDVLEGVDQIATAWGQAAIAATAIHNDLRERDL